MQRHRQTFEEIISKLSAIHSEWKDDRAGKVIELLGNIPEKSSYTRTDLRSLLESDFKAALTLIQLILDVSKDELNVSSRSGGKGFGVKAFRSDPEPLLQRLED